MNRALPLIALAAVLVSCDSEGTVVPNVEGTYTLNLKVTKLDCAMLPDAALGDESTGVTVVLTQDPSNREQVTATVQGLAGVLLTLGLGGSTFVGTVDRNALDLVLEGNAKLSADACAYSQVARLRGTLEGDFLSGTIAYSYATNHASDCGIKETCSDEQTVTGSRPATTP